MITFLILTITSSSFDFNIAKGTEIFESPWLLQLFSECSQVLFGPFDFSFSEIDVTSPRITELFLFCLAMPPKCTQGPY